LGLPSSYHPVIFLLLFFLFLDYTLQKLLCSLAFSSSPSLLISLMGISINMGNWDLKALRELMHNILSHRDRLQCAHLLPLLYFLLSLPIFLQWWFSSAGKG